MPKAFSRPAISMRMKKRLKKVTEQYVIQKRRGRQKGIKGCLITILSPDRKHSKSLTVHGYTVDELHEKIFLFVYKLNQRINDKLKEESVRWAIKYKGDRYRIRKNS